MPDPAWVDGLTPLNAVNLTKLQTRDEKAVANGYASLDGTGKVPTGQLPASSAAGSSGLLALRPSAASSSASFYYATDQDVLFFSTGSAWLRIGLPAGATTMLFSNVIPNGWVAYDGGTLPSSAGIYADLYAHLGSTTTKPDTQSRVLVPKGTHTDVDTLGKNEGVATLANRTPRHNSTAPAHTLTLPPHVHGPGTGGAYRMQSGGTDNVGTAGAGDSTQANTGNPTSTPAISGAIGAPGPGGTRPVDAPAFIVFSVVIAKL